MSKAALDVLRDTFPNFPESLAKEWLAPYVEDWGAPESTGRWQYVLASRPVEFWQGVNWSLDQINMVEAMGRLALENGIALVDMGKAYFEGAQNEYAQIRDGKQRTLRALEYLRERRVFPCPPALLRTSSGTLKIMDGNHRILAFLQATKLTPPVVDEIQEVWIAEGSN